MWEYPGGKAAGKGTSASSYCENVTRGLCQTIPDLLTCITACNVKIFPLSTIYITGIYTFIIPPHPVSTILPTWQYPSPSSLCANTRFAQLRRTNPPRRSNTKNKQQRLRQMQNEREQAKRYQKRGSSWKSFNGGRCCV